VKHKDVHKKLQEQGVTVTRNTYDVWIGRLNKFMDKFDHSGKFSGQTFRIKRGEPKFVPVAVVKDRWDTLLTACRERNGLILHELELSGRYMPELYVTRKQAEQEFKSFLKSRHPLLVMTGESGRGKTNLICELVRKCKRPALLFLGEQYQQTVFRFPEEVDATLLRLFGSSGPNIAQSITLQDISRMASDMGSVFLVFVDALNEFRQPAAVLETMIRWVIEQERVVAGVRICLTCREESWRHLTREKQLLLTAGLIYASSPRSVKPSRDLHSPRPCLHVPEFSDEELADAVKSYRKAYRVKGDLSPEAKEVCCDPFMLRLVFEAFEDRELPPDVLKTKILDAFWDKKIRMGTPGKEELVQDLADHLAREDSPLIFESQLRRLPWYNARALRELLDLNVLIRVSNRYESRITFFHHRFFGYALARRLYQQREDIHRDPNSFMAKTKLSGALLLATEQFLGMLEGDVRRNFCRRIAGTGTAGVWVVCRAIGNATYVDDQDFELVRDLFRDDPGSRLFPCLDPVLWCRPHECLNLVEEVLPDVISADADFNLASLFFASAPCVLKELVKVFPGAADKLRSWLDHEDERVRGMVIWAYVHYLASFDKEKAFRFVVEAVRNDTTHVRSRAAYALHIVFDFRPDESFSLCKELADDEDRFVRFGAIHCAFDCTCTNPEMFSKFKAWADPRKPRLRQSLAWLSGRLLTSTSGEIWDTVIALSHDEEDSVRLDVYRALTQANLLPPNIPAPYDMPEVLALLEADLRRSTSEFRERLAANPIIWSLEAIQKACETWVNADSENLRHFAALIAFESSRV